MSSEFRFENLRLKNTRTGEELWLANVAGNYFICQRSDAHMVITEESWLKRIGFPRLVLLPIEHVAQADSDWALYHHHLGSRPLRIEEVRAIASLRGETIKEDRVVTV